MRITSPTYTQTPNDLFDHWLPILKESELKVLLVIMRKTFGWHKVRDRISISQLSKLTGLTEETVSIATKSLQKKGVILKQVIGELGMQQTFYELVVEEDSNNSYPSDLHPPLGFTPLGESEAQKKPSSTKEKQQQGASAPAADSSKKEEKKPQIYDCLYSIDIPKQEKIWLTRKYDEKTLKDAIAWATSPQTKITTTLIQAIKWACHNPPEVPKNQDEVCDENQSYAKQFDEMRNDYAQINVLSKFIEIAPLHGQNGAVFIDYSEKDFKSKLEEAMRRYKFLN